MDTKPVLAGKDKPVLDRSRSVGDVYGSDDGSRFYQDGHYFAGTGDYLFSDESAVALVKAQRQLAATQVEVQQRVEADAKAQAERTISEAELPELMVLHEAKELLSRYSMPQIIKMIEKAGGPIQHGENAQQLMVGWLIKYTL